MTQGRRGCGRRRGTPSPQEQPPRPAHQGVSVCQCSFVLTRFARCSERWSCHRVLAISRLSDGDKNRNAAYRGIEVVGQGSEYGKLTVLHCMDRELDSEGGLSYSHRGAATNLIDVTVFYLPAATASIPLAPCRSSSSQRTSRLGSWRPLARACPQPQPRHRRRNLPRRRAHIFHGHRSSQPRTTTTETPTRHRETCGRRRHPHPLQ